MKVICDVCGTTFPETETHCPICGCAKTADAQTIPGDDTQNVQESTAASYTKGGRFSEKNVQRNTRSKYAPSRNSREPSRQSEKQSGSNKALIAVVVLLLLAIVGVVVYIAVNLILNNPNTVDKRPDNSQTDMVDQTDETEKIPCTSINLGLKIYEFKAENEQVLLQPELTPENTTDTVIFVSSDPNVAFVDANGMLRPGTKQGETVITVICGDAKPVECRVISKVGEAPEDVTPEPPAPEVPAGFVLKLNRADFSSAEEGFKWDLLKGIDTMGVSASDITWTSSDSAVATVENGVVTCLNRGTVTITATIAGQSATCIVRCNFDAAPPSDYKISHVDVTIAVGETFNLSLKHKETGANVQGIAWQATQDGIVSITGNKIKGQTVCWSGIEVFVEYEGIRYACRIIVKPAPTT